LRKSLERRSKGLREVSEELLRELIRRVREVLKEDVPTNEHPLRILHHSAKTVYELCSQALWLYP